MKTYTIILLTFLSFYQLGEVLAQDTLGGTIKYTRTIKFTYSPTGNPKWDNYAKTLPGKGKFDKSLYFSEYESHYISPMSAIEMKGAMTKAMYLANYGKTPKPKVLELYCDLKKNKKTEQLEFMTRYFITESDIIQKNWKLTNEKKKIQNYTCMAAKLISEKDTVIAWFTPQIPIAVGPSEYYGLPGLVLAVERNRETIFLATSIELVLPDKDVLIKPDLGKKVSQKELDKIVAEKIEEFKNTEGNTGKKDYYKK